MDVIELLRESLADVGAVFAESGTSLQDLWARFGTRAMGALVVLGVLAALYVPARWVTMRAVRRWAPRLERPLPHLMRVAFWVVLAASWSAIFPATRDYGGPILRAGVIYLLGYGTWHVTHRFIVRAITEREMDPSLLVLITNGARGLFAVLGGYLILREFDINLLPVVGGLGVAGLAVGFAAQDILANLIAGAALLVDRPFSLGHWIRIGELEGRVDRITLRTTRIRTRDNETISVPNAEIAAGQVVNLSLGGPLRLNIPLGIAYKEDTRAARQALLPVLERSPNTLAEPAPRIDVVELGDSSVNLLMRAWIPEERIPEALRIRARLLEQAKHALDEAGIEIPFPHLQLFIDDASGFEPVVGHLVDRRA